ncbi:MAG: hypothetical protein RR925_05435 [Erysipelotrichaceae bacterium]
MYNSCKCGSNQYESNACQSNTRNRCSSSCGGGGSCGCSSRPWRPAPCSNSCGCSKPNSGCGCSKPSTGCGCGSQGTGCGCKPIVDKNIYYECRRVSKCDVESGYTCYCFKNKKQNSCLDVEEECE